MTPQEIIEKIKQKATEYAKSHSTEIAKISYIQGKRDAACTILTMIQEDGLDAIIDVAKQIIKHDPNNKQAKWILENDDWKGK